MTDRVLFAEIQGLFSDVIRDFRMHETKIWRSINTVIFDNGKKVDVEMRAIATSTAQWRGTVAGADVVINIEEGVLKFHTVEDVANYLANLAQLTM